MITIVEFDDYVKSATVIILEESGTKFVIEIPWPDLVRYHGLGIIKGDVTSPQFPDGQWVVDVNLETTTHVADLYQQLLSLAQKGETDAASIS